MQNQMHRWEGYSLRMGSFGTVTDTNHHTGNADDSHVSCKRLGKADSGVSLPGLNVRFHTSSDSSDDAQSNASFSPLSTCTKPLPPSADYLRLILSSKVYDAMETTPLTIADSLSDQLGCKIRLKREDLNDVSSYKLRGVYNQMAHLHESQRWRGVITYSTGNQALSVALAAKKLRIPAIIVMPRKTPDSICRRLRRLDSTLVLHGTTLEAAKEESLRLQQQHSLANVSSCSDPFVIAGHGTVGMEILHQVKDMRRVEAIVCPVGCGSLIAGLGLYVKRVAHHIKIIGVECEEDDEDASSQELPYCETMNPEAPQECSALDTRSTDIIKTCAEVVDDIVRVTKDEVAAASKDAFEDTRHMLECPGLVSIAGLRKWVTGNRPFKPGFEVIGIVSEANLDYFSIPNFVEHVGAQIAKRK